MPASANPQAVNSINNTEQNTFNITPKFSQLTQTIGENVAPTFTQPSGGPYFGESNTSAFNFTGTGTNTISNVAGRINAIPLAPSSSTGTLTVTNGYGTYATSTIAPGANGVVTNAYAFACDTPTGATNNYTASFISNNVPTLVGIGTETPNQALSVVGGTSYSVTPVTTATYTVLNTDNTLEVNFTGPVTLTLPAASTSNLGQVFTIKDASGAAQTNPITISTSSGLIDGSTSAVISANDGYLTVFSNGTNYYIIDAYLSPPEGPNWVNVPGTSAVLAYDFSYYTTNASLTTLSLPTTAPAGSIFSVTGAGSGLWTITQGAGQQIQVGNAATTLGTGGSLASTSIGDSAWFLCTQSNTNFQLVSSVGNLIVT